jgi:AraC family transcriptional regulator
VRQLRIKRAGELLLSTTLSVGEIAERCGYASPRTFRKAFASVTGVSPIQFKKQYQI